MGTGELDVGIRKQFQSAELKNQSRRVTEKDFMEAWSGVCRQQGQSLAKQFVSPEELLLHGPKYPACFLLQDVQHVDIDYMDRKLDFTLSPSFQNLGPLIEQMKKNGTRFVLVLVGVQKDQICFLLLQFKTSTVEGIWMKNTEDFPKHFL